MKKILIVCIIVICNTFIYSQLKQILVLNEGAFDFQTQQILVPVTVGSFNPASGVYSIKNEIPSARFASDIVIDGDTYWVAADKYLLQFDLLNHLKQKEFFIEGIRKIAFYNDYLIVSRGEYLKTFTSYVQIYNKNTFHLLYELPYKYLPYSTESIVIHKDFAYIGANNGFEFGKEVGKVVKIDLKNLTLSDIIDLGPDAKNPENLMLHDEILISLNNRDYTGSSVSLINLNSSEKETFRLSNVSSLCGTSTLIEKSVVYQEIGKTDLGVFSFSTKQSTFLKNLGISYYGMIFDPVSKFICAAETDFRTTGKVFIYDTDFNERFQFTAGITPGYFAFDHSNTVKVKESLPLQFELSPNPIVTNFKIFANQAIEEIRILDFYGRELIRHNNTSVDLSSIQAGAYILMIRAKDKVAYKRFIKRST